MYVKVCANMCVCVVSLKRTTTTTTTKCREECTAAGRVGWIGRFQCAKEHLSEGCNAYAHHASVFKALVIPIQFHISRIVH